MWTTVLSIHNNSDCIYISGGIKLEVQTIILLLLDKNISGLRLRGNLKQNAKYFQRMKVLIKLTCSG